MAIAENWKTVDFLRIRLGIVNRFIVFTWKSQHIMNRYTQKDKLCLVAEKLQENERKEKKSIPLEARGKWKGLEGSVRLRGKFEKGEEEDMIVAEEELITVSMGIDSVQQREDKLSESA